MTTITRKEIADILGAYRSRLSIIEGDKSQGMPRPVEIVGFRKTRLYDREEIMTWIEKRRASKVIPSEAIITRNEIAELLECSLQHVVNMDRDPASGMPDSQGVYGKGHTLYYNRADMLAWIDEKKNRQLDYVAKPLPTSLIIDFLSGKYDRPELKNTYVRRRESSKVSSSKTKTVKVAGIRF